MMKLIGILLSLTMPFSYSSAKTQDVARIEFIYGGKKIEYVDNKIIAPDHTVAEEIERRMINAPLFAKLKQVERCLQMGASMKNSVLYSFPLLQKTVDEIVSAYTVAPQESRIQFYPENKPMFEITKAKSGLQISERKIYEEIFFSLKKAPRAVIALKPMEILPAVTETDNAKLTNKIAAFSTSFASSNENRRHNIALALANINGTVLLPNKQFSFNAKVGSRSEENGFKIAKIIVNGEYKEGRGGGVCQASTTLYNAAILADLRIDAVRNHSLVPSYIAPSFDAMVNATSSDLKFTNIRETPIFIRCYTLGNDAKIEIYGAKIPYTIHTESNVLKRGEVPQDKELIDFDRIYTDSETPPTSKIRVFYGQGSLLSEGFVIKKDLKGNVIERKKIRHDNYISSPGLVAVPPPATSENNKGSELIPKLYVSSQAV